MLTEGQRHLIVALMELQRKDLNEIVTIRRGVARELRRFLKGEVADYDKVLSLSKRYGELDGSLSYLYATTFAKVGQALSLQQRRTLEGFRSVNPSDPKGPFLYSTPIVMPTINNTDMFFGVSR